MRLFISALLALNVALLHAAPQNTVVVEEDAEKAQVAVVGEKKSQKGDQRDMFLGFQNDGAMVKTCLNGISCEFMTVAEAKALEHGIVSSVQAVKGESAVTKALSPALITMSESMKSLQAQQVLLANLEASMNALKAQSDKGQALAQAANYQLANRMTKGLSFAPPTKGQFAFAPMTPPKGIMAAALPPSKGASMASGMRTEAMLCPMTMFELGKCNKLSMEMKVRMDASNYVNAQLMAEKQRLERLLAASESLRAKAEQQATFNAKYATEQKIRGDVLQNGLNQCTVEKAMVKQHKENVEAVLEQTKTELGSEREKNAKLTAELKQCNEDKAALTESLAKQTARAEKAEADLADTTAKLEAETDKVIALEEKLTFTEKRLARCEADLKQERTTREQTEEELMKTMTALSSCQKENRITIEMLSRTRAELLVKVAALARETAARATLEAKLTVTIEKLREAEQEIRDTKRKLEDEENDHTTTRRILAETKEELASTEAARKALEEANKQLQNELAETKFQLKTMTNERDELQVTLGTTSAALAKCTAEKMKCEADLAQQQATSATLAKQLTDALVMLKAEKDAREQLTATIVLVQETSLKVQAEVRKLQTENIQLQSQVKKLQEEQGVALALAAGCPPTYEKFGSSCYKYVREKTQWKMAQEQCMKDSGNLVSVESTKEQVFVTNYLKRHGASDAYSHTSGHKKINGWKWLGAANNHVGANGVDFWFNLLTQAKPGYDCQAMYLYDRRQYGKWVGLPCYSSAPYVCEYNLIPHNQAAPSNPAEQLAILKMSQEAPPYLQALVRA